MPRDPLRLALGVLLYASTCVACKPSQRTVATLAASSPCVPIFGSDDVLVAPNDPRGLADSGLIIIAKFDTSTHTWKSCGVSQ